MERQISCKRSQQCHEMSYYDDELPTWSGKDVYEENIYVYGYCVIAKLSKRETFFNNCKGHKFYCSLNYFVFVWESYEVTLILEENISNHRIPMQGCI